jgi:hypothetical protein
MLDVAFFAIDVALLRRGDTRGVDDLAAHRRNPTAANAASNSLEENLDRRFAGDPRLRERFAEGSDRVRVRHRVTEPQGRETA